MATTNLCRETTVPEAVVETEEKGPIREAQLMNTEFFNMSWTMKPPVQPGTYWFRRDPPSRAMMVQVRETNGELTVWWADKDQPVTTLKAYWRGPIPPSPESRIL